MYLVNIEYLYFRQLHACNFKKTDSAVEKTTYFSASDVIEKILLSDLPNLVQQEAHVSNIYLYRVLNACVADILFLLWTANKVFFGTKIEKAKYAVFKFSLSEKLS